jgi:hypothetical protein
MFGTFSEDLGCGIILKIKFSSADRSEFVIIDQKDEKFNFLTQLLNKNSLTQMFGDRRYIKISLEQQRSWFRFRPNCRAMKICYFEFRSLSLVNLILNYINPRNNLVVLNKF